MRWSKVRSYDSVAMCTSEGRTSIRMTGCPRITSAPLSRISAASCSAMARKSTTAVPGINNAEAP